MPGLETAKVLEIGGGDPEHGCGDRRFGPLGEIRMIPAADLVTFALMATATYFTRIRGYLLLCNRTLGHARRR